MRVLGIDPGSANIGYGVVEEKKLLDFGVWKPTSTIPTMNEATIDILRQLYLSAVEVVEEHQVTHIAVEMVPFVQMAQRDKVVAVLNLFRTLALFRNLHFKQMSARVVKEIATNNSKATKTDMKKKAIGMFGEDTFPPRTQADVFDAILIAHTARLDRKKWWSPLEETR